MDEASHAQGSAAVPAAVAGRLARASVRSTSELAFACPHWDKDGGLYSSETFCSDLPRQGVPHPSRREGAFCEIQSRTHSAEEIECHPERLPHAPSTRTLP